mmetsp:Transcript_125188/g.286848  ORF Transcript_125188/g.286848 Transcript_125188/m.286848 type:complete len:212 (+) Transcript_125188:278-913(+)
MSLWPHDWATSRTVRPSTKGTAVLAFASNNPRTVSRQPRSTATCNKVLPSSSIQPASTLPSAIAFTAWTPEPRATSAITYPVQRTGSLSSCPADIIAGRFSPATVVHRQSAPAVTSATATSRWPVSTAILSGVPRGHFRFGSACEVNSMLMVSTDEKLETATCSGASIAASLGSASAPPFNSRSTMANSFAANALVNGVEPLLHATLGFTP